MAHLLMVVALISYGPEISPCAYATKPNRRAKRQHVYAPYWFWSHTHDSSYPALTKLLYQYLTHHIQLQKLL